jgi:hypothetical protein
MNMTIAEKLEMYANKKAFIDNVSKAFAKNLSKSSVTSLEYEVYHRKVTINGEERDHYVEYVVVNFIGGGKCVRFVSGNSNTANFRVIGEMLDGGYYDEIPTYNGLKDKGFKYVILKPYTDRLGELLSKPMTHISDVRACFNYCKTCKDVVKVIDSIPAVFGSFNVKFNDDGETFLITNSYEENGDYLTDEAEYEFFVEES